MTHGFGPGTLFWVRALRGKSVDAGRRHCGHRAPPSLVLGRAFADCLFGMPHVCLHGSGILGKGATEPFVLLH